MTILEKIKKNAKDNPDRIAIISENKKLTWKQLDDYSNSLAYELDYKLKTKTPIVVYGHKDPYMIVCFLACVKTGRAYCPIDINVPLNRIVDIIKEVNPEIVLSTEELNVDANVLTKKDIESIIENNNDKNFDGEAVKKEDVFYIIFTSGSTGKPKGVQITRDCLDNFIKWGVTLGNNIDNNKHYTFINQAPFSFDLSVMDLYLSLYTGGTLWTLSKKTQGDMKELCLSLKQSKANIWVSTPSFADVCLSEPSFSNSLLPNLELFLFCGEVLNNKTVERLHERFKTAKIINTYGPTESTVAITEVEVTDEINKTITPLPVGKAKPGTWINIVDENNNLVKPGEKGEIVIIGDSVSIGYFQNQILTEKSFGKTIINDKEYRYYKTGDEGYIIDDMLYYCGRIDLQIKLHGYRIEIEDIENNIMKLEGVKQVAVIPKYRNDKVNSLVAFVVSSKKIEDEFEESQRIRTQLKNNIPEYMVPKKIKFVDSLPRTNNGKIDRKSLGGML